MKSLLKTLAMTKSPAGDSCAMFSLLQNKLQFLDCRQDAHGTLLAHKKGEGTSILFLAAMDTPCLFVTAPDKGFSRIMASDDFSVPDGTVTVTTDGQYAVIGKDDAGQYADAGSVSLPVGTRLVPCPSCTEIDADRFSGFAMGQYAAMCALLSAALSDTKRDAYFVFGTKTCIRQFSPAFMQNINAELLVSVEVSAANDAPAEKTVFLSLGDGTALRVKDASMLSAPAAMEIIESTPFKTTREVSLRRGVGGSVQKAFGGIKSVGLGIPTRHIGTMGETVDLKDIENTANILSYLLQ